jgi:hypothetical protein
MPPEPEPALIEEPLPDGSPELVQWLNSEEGMAWSRRMHTSVTHHALLEENEDLPPATHSFPEEDNPETVARRLWDYSCQTEWQCKEQAPETYSVSLCTCRLAEPFNRDLAWVSLLGLPWKGKMVLVEVAFRTGPFFDACYTCLFDAHFDPWYDAPREEYQQPGVLDPGYI